MEQDKKPYRPTPEEFGRLLQRAREERLRREASDPEFREEMERLERLLFGPRLPKEF